MEGERKLIFVRHLATQFNRERRLMGRKFDLPILEDDQLVIFRETLNRIREAEMIDPDLSLVVSSPLLRCLQTSKIIKSFFGIQNEIQVSDLIVETDLGDFAGFRGKDLRANFGNKVIEDWMFRPASFTFPGGESYVDLESRVEGFLGFLNSNPEWRNKRNLFICTHGDFIKMFLLVVQSRSFDERRRFDIKNGSISIVRIKKNELEEMPKYEIVLVNFSLEA
jgi:broad specificity phosphatase PhoE